MAEPTQQEVSDLAYDIYRKRVAATPGDYEKIFTAEQRQNYAEQDYAAAEETLKQRASLGETVQPASEDANVVDVRPQVDVDSQPAPAVSQTLASEI